MKTVRWQLWLVMMIWCLVSKAFGQAPDEVTIQSAHRIPPNDRFLFSQQMICGVVHRMNLQNKEESETLDRLADAWADWLYTSQKAPEQTDWTELLRIANTISVRQQNHPIVVETEFYPRLTAFALPIDVSLANRIEEAYAKWVESRFNIRAKTELRSLLADSVDNADSSTSPETVALVKRHTEQLYTSPSPQNWNAVLYLGTEVKWSKTKGAIPGEKVQVDLGIQRVLASTNRYRLDVEREQGNTLCRMYWRAQARDDADAWSQFRDFISKMMSTKRLETEVTFKICDKNGEPTSSPITSVAYHPKADPTVVRTDQRTLRIISGDYRFWSERNGVKSSGDHDRLILGKTCPVTILETK